MKYALAIDLGAGSGRHMLGSMKNGRIEMEEIHRFPNGFISQNNHDCWDTEDLFDNILIGLEKCAKREIYPQTLAIDSWGVDYVLLDKAGKALGPAVSYRDNRTLGMDRLLEQKLPFAVHYGISGIAKQAYNSVYQLMAAFQEHPEYREKAASFLFIPCYFSYLLTGISKNEYSIASSSALLNAKTGDWSPEIISAAGLPPALFTEKPSAPGTRLGSLKPEIIKRLGFDCQVILPGAHDTASAFYAVPDLSPQSVYLSCGTWSLLGVQLKEAVLSNEAREAGFSNEGGVKGIRFLKNIMGLWILQRIKAEWQDRYSYAEMTDLAMLGADYPASFDVQDPVFLNPNSMVKAIFDLLARQAQPLPQNDAQLLYCVHHSLALSYAQAISELSAITKTAFTAICMVGGGSQNRLLKRLTEEVTGLKLIQGPCEGSALGNLTIQLTQS